MLSIAILLLIVGVVLIIVSGAGPSTVPPVFAQVGWLLFIVGLILLVVALVLDATDAHAAARAVFSLRSSWGAADA